MIIDLPQAVDAAGNNHASRMLLRDVANLRGLLRPLRARAAAHRTTAQEIWDLYERGVLQPDTALTGRFEREAGPVDLGGVMREIDDARAEEAARLLRMQSIV